MNRAHGAVSLAIVGAVLSLLAAGCDNAAKGPAGGELRIATPSLSYATVGQSYRYDVTMIGGSAPFAWSVSDGSLPPGIELDDDSTRVATLSGLPTATGDFDFTLSVRDGAGNAGTRAYSLRCVARPLLITTSGLSDGDVGEPYADVVVAGGGVAPYSFNLTGGVFPVGLVLAPDGNILGAPTVAADSAFTVQVTDFEGATATRQYIIRTFDAVELHLPAVSAMNTGAAYAYQVTATGGSGSYVFTLQGAAPAGVSMTPGGILRIDTTVAAGNYSVEVYVLDTRGNYDTGTLDFGLVAVLRLITTSLSIATPGVSYSATITATGGVPDYTWEIESGTLPSGMQLDNEGTPSTSLHGSSNDEGAFSFTVCVTDAAGNEARRNFQLHLVRPLEITTASLPSTLVNEPYNVVVSTSGGSRIGQQWTLSAGQLPAGLRMNGHDSFLGLEGSTSQPGLSTFTLNVVDSLGFTTSKQFSIDVTFNPLEILAFDTYPYYDLPMGVVGVPYSTTIQARGGTGHGYAWTIDAAGSPLPAGLNLQSGTPNATLSGNPVTPAVAAITVKVVDSYGNVAERGFYIRVASVSPYTAGYVYIGMRALPNGTVGYPYRAMLEGAYGNWAGYTWTFEGAFPPGLSIVNGTPLGWITGTPATEGTYVFNLRLTSSNGATDVRLFTVTMSAPGVAPVSLGTGLALPANWMLLGTGASARAFSMIFRGPQHLLMYCEGGTGYGYTWTVVSGTLPQGLVLESDGSSVAHLHGEVSGSLAPGRYSFRIRVSDSAGESYEIDVSLDLDVTMPP